MFGRTGDFGGVKLGRVVLREHFAFRHGGQSSLSTTESVSFEAFACALYTVNGDMRSSQRKPDGMEAKDGKVLPRASQSEGGICGATSSSTRVSILQPLPTNQHLKHHEK